MSRLGLWEGYGVEIEYMIVDEETLDVRPVCDRLLESLTGEPVSEVERGELAWSNELVLHVLELKTNGPAGSLGGLEALFHRDIVEANSRLAGQRCTLMPGGVHPWMDPSTQTRLWPHEHNEVYRTFDRIFGCSGHGWSNLQSTHLNLPFDGDDEFHRLHSAIRVALPLIPALAAASPVLDGIPTGVLDTRLRTYAGNARRVPEVTGRVIPRPVASEQEYRDRILEPLYEALRPHDPEGVLRHEWANARGAIARFERGAIEIRVIDAQECPSADLAVLGAVVGLVRALAEERWASIEALDSIETDLLADVMDRTIERGPDAELESDALRTALGSQAGEKTVGQAWAGVVERLGVRAALGGSVGEALGVILNHGPLAGRIIKSHEAGRPLRVIARGLVNSLASDAPFRG